jgi:hypothetical protein
MLRLSTRQVSSHFLNLRIVGPQEVGLERVEQELLLRRLKPVEAGYHRDLCCMGRTRESLLNQITEWVAKKSGARECSAE